MPAIQEISGTSIVLVGEFPPAVFRPEWFSKKGLLDDAEVESAKIDIISREFTSFSTAWLAFQVDRQRLLIGTTSQPLVRAFDLALGLLSHFADAPVLFVGLNRDAHVKMGTMEAWHRLGDRLAPKDCWPQEFTRRPAGDHEGRWAAGLTSLTMRRPRENPPGYTDVRIEPSALAKPFGVYFCTNDHYDLQVAGNPAPAQGAVEIIAKYWEPAMEYANSVMNSILEKVR